MARSTTQSVPTRTPAIEKRERFKAQARKLIKLADSGNAKAIEKFQGYSPKTRERIADVLYPGIRGNMRKRFIDDAITPQMQHGEAKSQRLLREAAARAKRTEAKQGKSVKARASANQRKRNAAPKGTRKPLPKGAVTPADIAKRAKVAPVEVRKYLRSQKRIKKSESGWVIPAKQVDAVVKAVKAAAKS